MPKSFIKITSLSKAEIFMLKERFYFGVYSLDKWWRIERRKEVIYRRYLHMYSGTKSVTEETSKHAGILEDVLKDFVFSDSSNA